MTEEKNVYLLKPGMVTDALRTGFSGDGLADLILDGEVRDVVQVRVSTGKEILIFALNNDSL